MNKYELVVLYDPDLEVDITKAETIVKKIVEDNKATITNSDQWGKRKLAYPIAKNEYAFYILYTIEAPTEAVKAIEAKLNITDEVIRYLIVKIDPKEQAKMQKMKEEALKRKARKQENGDRAQEQTNKADSNAA